MMSERERNRNMIWRLFTPPLVRQGSEEWEKRSKERKSKARKTAYILVTKAQAMSLGEDFTDFSCPFNLSPAQEAKAMAKKARARKAKAGRKK